MQWENFLLGVPPGREPGMWHDLFLQWADAYLASDPTAKAPTPRTVKVPLGPIADAEAARGGILPYDPGAIAVPVLLVRGEWDAVSTAADVESLYAEL